MDDTRRVETGVCPEKEEEGLDVILDSPALQRLIEEVRHEGDDGVPRSYNRTFNRHNR